MEFFNLMGKQPELHPRTIQGMPSEQMGQIYSQGQPYPQGQSPNVNQGYPPTSQNYQQSQQVAYQQQQAYQQQVAYQQSQQVAYQQSQQVAYQQQQAYQQQVAYQQSQQVAYQQQGYQYPPNHPPMIPNFQAPTHTPLQSPLQSPLQAQSQAVHFNQMPSQMAQSVSFNQGFLDARDENHTIIQSQQQRQLNPLIRAKLTVLNGEQSGQVWFLNRPKSTLGRGLENEFVLQDIATSRKHIEIIRHDQGFKLMDMKSANGTLLNQKRIAEEELYDGDVIKVGQLELQFEYIGISRSRISEENTDPSISLKNERFSAFQVAKENTIGLKDQILSFYWQLSDRFDDYTSQLSPRFASFFKIFIVILSVVFALYLGALIEPMIGSPTSSTEEIKTEITPLLLSGRFSDIELTLSKYDLQQEQTRELLLWINQEKQSAFKMKEIKDLLVQKRQKQAQQIMQTIPPQSLFFEEVQKLKQELENKKVNQNKELLDQLFLNFTRGEFFKLQNQISMFTEKQTQQREFQRLVQAWQALAKISKKDIPPDLQSKRLEIYELYQKGMIDAAINKAKAAEAYASLAFKEVFAIQLKQITEIKTKLAKFKPILKNWQNLNLEQNPTIYQNQSIEIITLCLELLQLDTSVLSKFSIMLRQELNGVFLRATKHLVLCRDAQNIKKYINEVIDFEINQDYFIELRKNL
jgi:pSer/pThr/pTyr-binding forkhead associated (FHA) protein